MLAAALLFFLVRPAWALEAGDVKKATDKVGNWLIEQYDVKEKAFKGEQGKDVKTVAMIIYALCKSPREYRETNGPFISEPVKFLISQMKEDGTFANPELNKTDAAVWVGVAFEATGNAKYKPLLEKMAKVKTAEPEKPNTELKANLLILQAAAWDAEIGERKDQAGEIAEKALKLRQKNGSFGEDLQANAMALDILTLCYKALK